MNVSIGAVVRHTKDCTGCCLLPQLSPDPLDLSHCFRLISSFIPLLARGRAAVAVGFLEVVVGENITCCCRRRQAQGAWPPDWGHGDTSRFPDFPDLPKSRAQLVPPTGSHHMRRSTANGSAKRQQAATPSQPVHEIVKREASHAPKGDISSAELDAMVFKQQLPRTSQSTLQN